jgi:NADH:ubiquinone oxidoreductase subunit H
MLIALILIVLAAIALILILLAVIVVGIRQEPRGAELSDVAPSPIAVLVRRLTGLYVRRPTPTAVGARGQGEGNPAGLAPQPKATT